MQQQPESISTSLPASPAPQPGRTGGPAPALEIAIDPATQRIPRWLERSELLLRVLLWMYFGLFICYLPWSASLPILQPISRAFWDQNPLFLQFPALEMYANSGVVRGLISGLGLLNIWIAFHDAIRHGTDRP